MTTVTNDKSKNEFIFYKLHRIEKSERMVRITMTDMRVHSDGHSNIRCTDSYSYLSEYELMKGRKKIPLEVLGLERSIQLLRPNGRMGIVLPDSILVNKSFNYVRKWLLQNVTI